MKTVCKKLLCLMLVAMMLVSAVPFAFAAGTDADAPTHKITYQLKEGTSKDVVKTYETSYIEGNTIPAAAFAALRLGIDQSEITAIWYEATDELIEGDAAQNATFECVDEGRIVVRVNGNTTPPAGDDDDQGTTQPVKYGTLYVTVYTYNAKNQAVEAGTVKFSGKASYKLSKELAEECFDEVDVVNYEEYRWQPSAGTVDMTDGDQYVNLVVEPIKTPGNRKIVTLTINHNRGNGNDDRQVIETLAGTKILNAISKAEDNGDFREPTRKGYRLAGYSFDVNVNNDVNRDDVINSNMTIYCEWELTNQKDKDDHDKNEHDKNEHDKNEHDKNDHKVTLRVYTNGDTRHADRVFDLDAYDNDGKITRNEVEKLLDSKYHAKSGHTLAYYGLFTEKTWDDGRYDVDDAVSSVKVNERGETVVYVMIKNVKKAVADSSNPKTGDNIMIAATTMALTAAALVSMIELKKRKMI